MTDTDLDIKATIRARKRARKLGLLDTPDTADQDGMAWAATVLVEMAPNDLDESQPPAEPDAPKPSGRTWKCRVCGARVQAPHIPAGWVSVNRWPPDRERLGPITATFCGPGCARVYLGRIEANGANVTYPTRKGQQ